MSPSLSGVCCPSFDSWVHPCRIAVAITRATSAASAQ